MTRQQLFSIYFYLPPPPTSCEIKIRESWKTLSLSPSLSCHPEPDLNYLEWQKTHLSLFSQKGIFDSLSKSNFVSLYLPSHISLYVSSSFSSLFSFLLLHIMFQNSQLTDKQQQEVEQFVVNWEKS